MSHDDKTLQMYKTQYLQALDATNKLADRVTSMINFGCVERSVLHSFLEDLRKARKEVADKEQRYLNSLHLSNKKTSRLTPQQAVIPLITPISI